MNKDFSTGLLLSASLALSACGKAPDPAVTAPADTAPATTETSAVAGPAADADQLPVLQFLEAVAHIGASGAQRAGNLFRIERAAMEKQQGVDLGDRAVHSPGAAHVAPMVDETVCDGTQLHGLSVCRPEISVKREICES